MLIAGGGLAGCLVALALRARRPDVSVTIVESGPSLGGNHIWSYFDSDVAAENQALVTPLATHRWSSNRVRFPGFERRFATPYNSIESERLDTTVRAALAEDAVITGTAITMLDSAGACLADGRRIEADGVIDSRGFAPDAPLDLGWQKFAGRLLRLDRPHGVTEPTIMDASVVQADGYRFVYLLPFDAERLFVEDTYYSDSASLDLPCLAGRIEAYAAARGWNISAVEREEAASLPIAMGGDFEALWRSGGECVAKIGMAAALFHPMTGYSLPDAVRTAAFIAALPDLRGAALVEAVHGFAEARWCERGFYRMLARMLFRAADPDRRWRVLERFYTLNEGLIGRFYAGESTLQDKIRIMLGRPPVPIGRALGALLP